MRGIPIYAPNAEDFSNNGLGLLLPTECTIHREGNSVYELTIIHPIAKDMRWAQIQRGCIVKAATPMRESPLYEMSVPTSGSTTTTVTRKIYRVQTNGGRLHLRQKPSTSSKILSKWKPGTEVTLLNDEGNGWYHVSIVKGGATGYMYASWLRFVRDVTETVTSTMPVTQNAVKVQPAREQLFRIYSVSPDTQKGLVTAKALPIAFDLRGNIINEDYKPEKVNPADAANHAFSKLLNPHDFALHCESLTGTVSGEYGYKSFIETLMEPETGIAAQTGARVEFDNFNIFLLPDVVRDMNVTVRRRKNLKGVVITNDDADAVTRIIPTGKDKDGNMLFLDGQIYVDSPHINDYPTIRARHIEYDVSVSDSKDAEFKTNDAARAELRRLVQADYDSGIDLSTYGMEVDFILLGNVDGREDFAALQSAHMFDTVTVIDSMIGLTEKLRVTEYDWDVLWERYTNIVLGDIQQMQRTTYGYSLAAGTVGGSKLIPNSAGGEIFRDLSIPYAKFSVATVEQLNAQAFNAVSAYIQKISAEEITADALYTALATIAVAQITAANIDKANIQWAEIESLNAQIAEIAKAHITDADIDWASIENLNAAIASITQAKIDNATITTAQISDLRAEIAKVITLSAQDGKFDFASIKDLLAQAMILEEGVAGSVMIKNLIATKANFVGATIGELVLQGDDGLYYKVVVQSDGTIRTEPVTLSDGEIAAGQTSDGRQIVATTANVDSLNASDIKAQSAIISSIFTSALTAGSITAQDAFLASATIPELRVTALKALGDTLDISANEQIRLIVGKVDNIQVGGRNLIRDSSMELGTGWNDYSSVSATDGMDGGACFKVTGALNTTKSVQQLPAIPEGYFKPGEQYVISYWARADNLAYGTANPLVGLVMEFYSNGTWAGDISLYNQIPAGTSDWTRYSSVVTIPDVAFDMVAPAQVFFRDYTGTVYIDKIQLEKGNQLTDWTSAPEDVDASIQAVANQTAEDMANVVSRIDSDIDSLQSQIDGSITTWFYPVPPTNSNLPAMDWATTDLKNLHLGDLYYDTVTGYCYRWQVQNNAYSWQRITDTDVTKALADASAAQDTADAKRRVFVSQPVPPYDKGDLWAQGSGGDIMRCQTAKIAGQSYAASDWVKASKYTDDTTANSALAQVGTLQTTVTSQQTEINQTKESIKLLATKSEVSNQINEQSARIDVLTDSINSRVEKSTYDQDMDGLREQVSAQYTDFTQTADGMKAEIGELQQDGDALRAYVRYGLENGVGTLSLGQTDSTYKAIVNNTGFTIQQDGSDMTYARKNTLSAPVVEARRVYQQGSYTVKVQADGGLMWN